MRNHPDNPNPKPRIRGKQPEHLFHLTNPHPPAHKGRSLRRPGRCPEPRHHFGEQGKITRLVVSSRRGQALPDGGPLRARDTPPLHSGPTARQPHRGAARRQPATPPLCEAQCQSTVPRQNNATPHHGDRIERSHRTAPPYKHRSTATPKPHSSCSPWRKQPGGCPSAAPPCTRSSKTARSTPSGSDASAASPPKPSPPTPPA